MKIDKFWNGLKQISNKSDLIPLRERRQEYESLKEDTTNDERDL